MRNLALVAAVVAIVASVAVAGVAPGAATTGTAQPAQRSNETAIQPGTQYSAVAFAQNAEIESAYRNYAFEVSYRNATTYDSQAAVVATELENTRRRVSRLEADVDALRRARTSGNISQNTYQTRSATLVATAVSLGNHLDKVRKLAENLPHEIRDRHDVTAAAFDRLDGRISRLTSSEVRTIAVVAVGQDVGYDISQNETADSVTSDDDGETTATDGDSEADSDGDDGDSDDGGTPTDDDSNTTDDGGTPTDDDSNTTDDGGTSTDGDSNTTNDDGNTTDDDGNTTDDDGNTTDSSDVFIDDRAVFVNKENQTVSTIGVTGGTERVHLDHKVTEVGPARKSLDADGTREIPYVLGNDLRVVGLTENGSATLDDSANVNNEPVGIGDYDGDGATEIYYNRGKSLYAVRAGESPTVVANETAFSNSAGYELAGVAGATDFDGDGAAEIVYSNNNNDVAYVDENGTLVQTGYRNLGDVHSIGRPADFDGDGEVRVPVVTDERRVALVDANGTATLLNSQYERAGTDSLAAHDIDGDGTLEVVFADTGEELHYMELDGTHDEVETGDGTILSANKNKGAA